MAAKSSSSGISCSFSSSTDGSTSTGSGTGFGAMSGVGMGYGLGLNRVFRVIAFWMRMPWKECADLWVAWYIFVGGQLRKYSKLVYSNWEYSNLVCI